MTKFKFDDKTDGGVSLDSGTAGIEPWQVSAPIWLGDIEKGEGAMPESNRLQAARERCAAATEGPWTTEHYGTNDCLIISDAGRIRIGRAIASIAFVIRANGNFIAHARTDLPWALDLLAEAAEALETAEWIRIKGLCVICPSCEGEGIHAPDCQLDAILSRIRAGGGGE